MHHTRRTLLTLALLSSLAPAWAQTAATPAKAAGTAKDAAPTKEVERDGQRDFDFVIGTFKVKLKRLVKPLTGSTTWVEYEGTSTGRKLWGGKGNIDEFVADTLPGAATKVHLEGITLRLYNPETRLWSLYWANAKNGVLAMPATVGKFVNGRGEFYDSEEFDGKMIIVRYVWSDITATSGHFEQSFSPDGGKTWEVNWISDVTRVSN